VKVVEVNKQSVAAAEAAALVAAMVAYAAMAPDPDRLLVPLEYGVIHPHAHHSHYPEVCYAHPAGHQEGDPQVYNPNNA
jgi:hypothetical protein